MVAAAAAVVAVVAAAAAVVAVVAAAAAEVAAEVEAHPGNALPDQDK